MTEKKKKAIRKKVIGKKAINFPQFQTNLPESKELKLLKNRQIIISTLAKNGHLIAYNVTKKANLELKQEHERRIKTLSQNSEDFTNEKIENKYFPRNLKPAFRLKKVEAMKKAEIGEMKKKSLKMAQSDVRYLLKKSLLKDHYVRVVGKPTPAHYGEETIYAVATKGIIIATLYEAVLSSNPVYLGEDDRATNSSKCVQKINPHKATFKIPIEGCNPPVHREYYVSELDRIFTNNVDFFGIDFSSLKQEVVDIARMSIVEAALDLPQFFLTTSYVLWELDKEFKGFSKCNIDKITAKLLEKLDKWEEIRRKEFLSRFFSEPLLRKWKGWVNWLELLNDPSRGKLVAEYLMKKESDYKSSKASIEHSLETIKEAKAYFPSAYFPKS